VRDALRGGAAERSYADVARRFGFTNAGRFAKAYRSRFGEAPAETAGRADLFING
jgi:transcriptional regulator GlxA family with amidase domain